MVKHVDVEGYDALEAAVAEHKGQTIYVYYSGSAGADGNSWCPDCVKSEPVVTESLSLLSESAVFIHCSVGDRAFWKDLKNIFRTKLGISSVPTLVKWGTGKQLVDDQCANKELLEMLFEDSDAATL